MMTTILFFLVGITLITLIARYNESEKLFWQLLVSFLGTYGAATIAINALDSEKKSNEVVITSKPMQAPASKPFTKPMCSLADLSCLVIVEKESPAPAGKDSTSKLTKVTLSKVGLAPRDQPLDTIMFDTS